MPSRHDNGRFSRSIQIVQLDALQTRFKAVLQATRQGFSNAPYFAQRLEAPTVMMLQKDFEH
ncbi:hypothetical protein PFLU3_57150 [Pseudomonas fluorescens]|uniref:Uncharacterized protein n=1 Tax=Pseudomonas fluorescens TaxID=294 RepID=A0A0D0SNU2_PSEFL|nr:hypothetical protein PFLU3_57150 [Pseudomonas fluorescens]